MVVFPNVHGVTTIVAFAEIGSAQHPKIVRPVIAPAAALNSNRAEHLRQMPGPTGYLRTCGNRD